MTADVESVRKRCKGRWDRLLRLGNVMPSLKICRLYLLGRRIFSENSPVPVGHGLEMVEVTIEDKDDIDEITRLDEWRISKNDTLKDMKEGRRCYVAKQHGRIVACLWVCIENRYKETHLLKRELHLAANEAFFGRSWTIPAFRGKGIFPMLQAYADLDLARRYGKTLALGWVRASNSPMIRSLGKLGYTITGKLGFIQFLNVRFHYLYASGILRETKRRCYFQKV